MDLGRENYSLRPLLHDCQEREDFLKEQNKSVIMKLSFTRKRTKS